MTDWVEYFVQRMIAQGAISSEDDLERLVGSSQETEAPNLGTVEVNSVEEANYETFVSMQGYGTRESRKTHGYLAYADISVSRVSFECGEAVKYAYELVLETDHPERGHVDLLFLLYGNKAEVVTLRAEDPHQILQSLTTPQQAIDTFVQLYVGSKPPTELPN